MLKIWKQIASCPLCPLCIGVYHEDMPVPTQLNIFYEFGVAKALGKETLLVKSHSATAPSDMVRTEHIKFDDQFEQKLKNYFYSLNEQAEFYESTADQLDRDPILAINYLRRAFLISGEERLREKVKDIASGANLEGRATNSFELLTADF